jgi:hypothetical protein
LTAKNRRKEPKTESKGQFHNTYSFSKISSLQFIALIINLYGKEWIKYIMTNKTIMKPPNHQNNFACCTKLHPLAKKGCLM